MLTGKTVSLALLSGENVHISAPLPRALGGSDALMVVGIFWADGLEREPPRWEVLAMPATFARLTSDHDPALVQRAVKTILGLVALKDQKNPTRDQVEAILTDGYRGLSPEDSQNLKSLLETLNAARTQVDKEGSRGVVVFVPDSQVRHAVRESSLDAVIDLMLIRRIDEEKTRLELDSDEIDEGTEEAKPTEDSLSCGSRSGSARRTRPGWSGWSASPEAIESGAGCSVAPCAFWKNKG